MDPTLTLIIDSTKALVLLTAAAVLALSLRGRPARIRAVVWGTALAGVLLIPAVAPLLPTWSLPLPIDLTMALEAPEPAPNPTAHATAQPVSSREIVVSSGTRGAPPHRPRLADLSWRQWLLTGWLFGFAIALCRFGNGLWRMFHAVSRALPVTDPRRLAALAVARHRVGCRRQVRLLVTDEIDVPATVGVARPVVVVPRQAATWTDERWDAVLLHEVIHVVRLDWPVRMIARIARAVYWFNPLAWWAVSRLDLEQELACDEEVLALGSRASHYACHLLGIARCAVRTPALAVSGLEMARRSHLEERIMTMLRRPHHRKTKLMVLLPAAALVGAMVPALAAVHPGDSPPRQASPELEQIIAEMEEVEARLEPHLEEIEAAIEVELEPTLEKIEAIEVEIDHQAFAEIEEKMRPHLKRIEEIEIDMEPMLAQIEAFAGDIENIRIHVEDGTLAEVQRQIQEQIEAHMAKIEEIHIDMEPLHEQIEAIHEQLEPMHEQIEAIHIDMEPMHEEIERLHLEMEPIHERIEEMHLDMEPIHEELGRLGERLEDALRGEVATVLREHLGAVTGPNAPFTEAAARILEDADVHVEDDSVRVEASRSEARRILTDLLAPLRVGAQSSFDAAIDDAAVAVSPLVLQVD
jgi:beta-lactamase regulating signal transducer with metallopeptidase domain/predicted  nucleic acid-binding Zn-ribbon protein